MDTNDLAFVKASLEAMRPADWDGVAKNSGVPLGTLRKIAYGEVTDPRFWTVKKLADYFQSVGESNDISTNKTSDASSGAVKYGRRSTDKTQGKNTP